MIFHVGIVLAVDCNQQWRSVKSELPVLKNGLNPCTLISSALPALPMIQTFFFIILFSTRTVLTDLPETCQAIRLPVGLSSNLARSTCCFLQPET